MIITCCDPFPPGTRWIYVIHETSKHTSGACWGGLESSGASPRSIVIIISCGTIGSTPTMISHGPGRWFSRRFDHLPALLVCDRVCVRIGRHEIRPPPAANTSREHSPRQRGGYAAERLNHGRQTRRETRGIGLTSPRDSRDRLARLAGFAESRLVNRAVSQAAMVLCSTRRQPQRQS